MKQNFRQIPVMLVLCALGLFSMTGCGGSASTDTGNTGDQENKAISHMLGEPANLNPYNTNDGAGKICLRRLFQPLVQLDFFKNELTPVLAIARPEIKSTEDGKVEMTFEIRPEAKWDNGQPITGEDVAFSLKIMNAPKLDNGALKLYFDYISDVVIDKENPRKFTFMCNKSYMLMESALDDLFIIPAYIYDADGVMKEYTLSQLTSGDAALEKDEKLLKLTEAFNGPKFQREVVIGSGPYNLEKWETGQRVTMTRKKDWYGDKVKGASHWFEAHPEKIVYEVIGDMTTAVVALKAGKIDAMNRIDPRSFVTELRKDEDFTSKFNTYNPTQFLYSYFGMNTKSEKLSDLKTRKALRLLMDVNKYDETIFYGLAERVNSFIHPSKKEFINPALKMYDFDMEGAKKLLAEAGWKDSNGNGVVDKKIDGELVELEIDFQYPNIAKTSEKGVLMFQENCRKAGVKILPRPVEFSVMLEDTKSHNFEMYFGIWLSSPLESDPKQIWHTESYNGGSNYVGFGTPRSDKLIEDLRSELDKEKRIAHYHELQQIIEDEVPYIFLSATQNRVAVSNKFNNVKPTGSNPGYFIPGFQITNAVAN